MSRKTVKEELAEEKEARIQSIQSELLRFADDIADPNASNADAARRLAEFLNEKFERPRLFGVIPI